MESTGKRESRVLVLIPILTIVIYLINQALGYGNIAMEQDIDGIKTTYLSSSLTGLSIGLEVLSLIKLVNRPVQSIVLMLISQLILMISDIAQGYNFYNAFINNGVFEVYFLIVAIGMLIYIWRGYSKQAKKDGKQLALSEYINFEREPLKIPFWAIFSILCTGLSLVLSSAYNIEVGLWSDNLPFRLYVGFTLFIPTLTTLAMYTASNLVYIFYGLMLALKVVTVLGLVEHEEFKWTLGLICLIQIVCYIYSLVRYRAIRKVRI